MAMRRKPNSSDRLRKTQLALYLDPKQAEALKALSAQTRVPQQAYLREGLDYVLGKYKKEVTRPRRRIPPLHPPTAPKTGAKS